MATGLPLASVAALIVLGQSPSPPSWLKPAATHVTAAASLEPRREGGPAGEVVVAIDVRPAPGIHVYAPGNKDYIPVSVSIEPSPALTPKAPRYPASEPFVFGESKEVLRVYTKPFRVRQPLGVRTEKAVTITGTLHYQACTDKVCFPPESLPIEVVLPARAR